MIPVDTNISSINDDAKLRSDGYYTQGANVEFEGSRQTWSLEVNLSIPSADF